MAALTENLDLLLLGYAGVDGTEAILGAKPEEIRARFGKAFITEEIVGLMGLPRLQFGPYGLSAQHILVNVETGEAVPEREPDLQAKKNAGEVLLSDVPDLLPGIYQRYGIRKVREIGKGGVLWALWDFLEEDSRDAEGKALGKPVGCAFRYDRIPLRAITIELCELFSLNPYRLYGENCFLVAAERGAQLCQDLTEHGVHCEIFGRTTGTRPRVRVDGKERSFLEKSRKDELDRLLQAE